MLSKKRIMFSFWIIFCCIAATEPSKERNPVNFMEKSLKHSVCWYTACHQKQYTNVFCHILCFVLQTFVSVELHLFLWLTTTNQHWKEVLPLKCKNICINSHHFSICGFWNVPYEKKGKKLSFTIFLWRYIISTSLPKSKPN